MFSLISFVHQAITGKEKKILKCYTKPVRLLKVLELDLKKKNYQAVFRTLKMGSEYSGSLVHYIIFHLPIIQKWFLKIFTSGIAKFLTFIVDYEGGKNPREIRDLKSKWGRQKQERTVALENLSHQAQQHEDLGPVLWRQPLPFYSNCTLFSYRSIIRYKLHKAKVPQFLIVHCTNLN